MMGRRHVIRPEELSRYPLPESGLSLLLLLVTYSLDLQYDLTYPDTLTVNRVKSY